MRIAGRPAVACVIVFTACVLVRAAADSDSPPQILFDRVRSKMLSNLDRVPRYTCVETVTRKQYRPQYGNKPAACGVLIGMRDLLDAPGLLVWHDRLRLDVAIGKDSEMFSWAGAREFESGELDKLTSTGATGSGAFSSFLASVFGNDAEQFRYTGEQDTPLGRLAAFDFVVPRAKSHYSYRTNNGTDRIIPYRGSFYAVPATGELRRLIVDAREFPSGDVCRVADTMDYKTVKIGSGDFALPDVSTMVVLYQNGDEARNETHFSNCHEFTGESTIRFDDPEEPSSAASIAKAQLKSLPPRTHIRVKIDPPIHSETAAAGDPVIGVVEREVKDKGQTLVRTTDRLHGRLLRLEQYMVPEPHWVVAIKFDAIERDGVEQPVSFKPLDDGDRSPPVTRFVGRRMRMAIPESQPERPAGAGLFTFAAVGNLVLDQKFHSEWETK